MHYRKPESAYFLRTGGPNRPASSAVYRRLTENASRHYEESGPTDKQLEGTDNPCRMAAARFGSARSICSWIRLGVSGMSAESTSRFRGRRASIQFRSRRAVYGATSVEIRKLAFCVPTMVYVAHRCIDVPPVLRIKRSE